MRYRGRGPTSTKRRAGPCSPLSTPLDASSRITTRVPRSAATGEDNAAPAGAPRPLALWPGPARFFNKGHRMSDDTDRTDRTDHDATAGDDGANIENELDTGSGWEALRVSRALTPATWLDELALHLEVVRDIAAAEPERVEVGQPVHINGDQLAQVLQVVRDLARDLAAAEPERIELGRPVGHNADFFARAAAKWQDLARIAAAFLREYPDPIRDDAAAAIGAVLRVAEAFVNRDVGKVEALIEEDTAPALLEKAREAADLAPRLRAAADRCRAQRRRARLATDAGGLAGAWQLDGRTTRRGREAARERRAARSRSDAGDGRLKRRRVRRRRAGCADRYATPHATHARQARSARNHASVPTARPRPGRGPLAPRGRASR